MLKLVYTLKKKEFLEYLKELNLDSKDFVMVLRGKYFTPNGLYFLSKKISKLAGLDSEEVFCVLSKRYFEKIYKYVKTS